MLRSKVIHVSKGTPGVIFTKSDYLTCWHQDTENILQATIKLEILSGVKNDPTQYE